MIKVNDNTLKIILIIFLGFFIIIPLYVNLFKESMWNFIKQKIDEQKKHDKIIKDMNDYKKKSK